MATVPGSGNFLCVAKTGWSCDGMRRVGCWKESSPLGPSSSHTLDRINDRMRSSVGGRNSKVRLSADLTAQPSTCGDGSEEAKSISDFLRFCDNGDGGSELQTAIVTYKKAFPWRLIQPQQVERTACLCWLCTNARSSRLGARILQHVGRLNWVLASTGWSHLMKVITDVDVSCTRLT